MNFERDIKSMQSIQGNHKRNSTTGRNMRPCQWILILIPSLLQMQGIVDQNSRKFFYEESTDSELPKILRFSMTKSYTGDKLKIWIDETNDRGKDSVR